MNAFLLLILAVVMQAGVLTQGEVDRLTDLCRDDPALFARLALKIAPKEKHTTGNVSLEFTPIQQRTNALMEHLRVDLKVPERVINAKARQVKLTTYWTSRAFWYHYFSTGPRQTDLIGDIAATTDSMFAMWDRYYENLPYYFERPVYSRATHKFKDTKAFVKCHTALTPNKRPAQGTTSSSVVATEVPYFERGEELLLAMLNAVPRLPGTLVVLEGTANGASGAFYERWLDAINHVDDLCRLYGAKDLYDLLWNHSGWGDKPDHNGETHPLGYWDGSFLPLFYGWWENPEYTRPARLENVTDATLTDEEHEIKATYGLTNDQMAWRRATIREQCGNSKRRFQQEYPARWQEAFLMSGSPVFDPELVDKHLTRTTVLAQSYSVQQTARGEKRIPIIQSVNLDWAQDEASSHVVNSFAPVYDTNGHCVNKDRLKVRAWADSHGWILMRHKPRPGWNYRYVIGADVAEGLEQGDYSTAFVMDRVDMTFPAFVRVHASEEQFALMLAKLGLWYGRAGILVERNKGGGGSEVINNLRKIYDRVLSGVRFHDGKDLVDKKLGWLTTHESKIVLVGAIQSYLEQNPSGLYFSQPWLEFTTFTREPNGAMGAEGKRLKPGVKAFDDSVIGLGVTFMAHRVEVPPVEIARHDVIQQQQKRESGTVRRLYDVNFS